MEYRNLRGFSESEEDVYDSDLFEEVAPNPLKKLMWIIVLLFAVIGAVSVWYYYMHRPAQVTQSHSLSIVRADNQPIKIKPEEPGGMAIPDRDKAIYDTLASRKGGTALLTPKVEKIGPLPEEPVSLNHLFPSAGKETHLAPAPVQTYPDDPVVEGNVLSVTEALKEKKLADVPVPSSSALPEKPTKSVAKAPVVEDRPKAKKPLPKGKIVVQLASFKKEKDAYDTWGKIVKKFPKLIGQLTPYVVQKEIKDRGLFFRLQAGPLGSEAEARMLCNKLIEAHQGCFVTKSNP